MGVGCNTSRTWIVPCLWCFVWAGSILRVVLISWILEMNHSGAARQNVRPLARIGACRALQGFDVGKGRKPGQKLNSQLAAEENAADMIR